MVKYSYIICWYCFSIELRTIIAFMASQFNQLDPVTRSASAPRPKHTYESVEIHDEVTQSSQTLPRAIAKLKSPASTKLVTRTSSAPSSPIATVKHTYESVGRHNDTKLKQIAPPPVAARPKSPNTEQTNTPLYGNVVMTKENTIRYPPVPPKRVSSTPPTERRNIVPATAKSEQQVSPVTEWKNTLPVAKNQQPSPVAVRNITSNKNTSNIAAIAKEIETKLHSPSSPVANRPILQISPVTARRNSPSYNNTPSTVTEPLQRAASPVAGLPQQASPTTKQRSSPLHDEDMYTVPAVTEGYVNTTDVLSSRQAVSSSKQDVPKQLTQPGLHNSKHTHDPQDYDYIAMHNKSQIPTTDQREIPAAVREANKAYLQSLSRRDVLQLLDNMNFNQHKRSFREEQVDGMTLAALTSNDLKELGVTKGVQVVRLVHLIEGKVSAKAILEKRNYH